MGRYMRRHSTERKVKARRNGLLDFEVYEGRTLVGTGSSLDEAKKLALADNRKWLQARFDLLTDRAEQLRRGKTAFLDMYGSRMRYEYEGWQKDTAFDLARVARNLTDLVHEWDEHDDGTWETWKYGTEWSDEITYRILPIQGIVDSRSLSRAQRLAVLKERQAKKNGRADRRRR